MKDEQALHVLVGMPGSGKTSFYRARLTCKEASPLCGAVRVSLDDFRKQCTGQEYITGFEPFVKMWADVTIPYLLAQGESVVVDATNLSRGIREKLLRDADWAGVRAVCWFIDTPRTEAWTRNSNRDRFVPPEAFSGMWDRFEVPSPEEDFDRMFRVTGAKEIWTVEEMK